MSKARQSPETALKRLEVKRRCLFLLSHTFKDGSKVRVKGKEGSSGFGASAATCSTRA